MLDSLAAEDLVRDDEKVDNSQHIYSSFSSKLNFVVMYMVSEGISTYATFNILIMLCTHVVTEYLFTCMYIHGWRFSSGHFD